MNEYIHSTKSPGFLSEANSGHVYKAELGEGDFWLMDPCLQFSFYLYLLDLLSRFCHLVLSLKLICILVPFHYTLRYICLNGLFFWILNCLRLGYSVP